MAGTSALTLRLFVSSNGGSWTDPKFFHAKIAEWPVFMPDDSDTAYSILPVVDGGGLLFGVVNLEEVYFAAHLDSLSAAILAEDPMRTDVTPLSPDDPLDRAQELFVENDLLALPAVSNLDERRLLGMMRRFDISNAYFRRIQGTGTDRVKVVI
jgi:CBS domain-containing protein